MLANFTQSNYLIRFAAFVALDHKVTSECYSHCNLVEYCFDTYLNVTASIWVIDNTSESATLGECVVTRVGETVKGAGTLRWI